MALNGFTNVGESTVTNDIRNNLQLFLDYGLLEKQNFINVGIPQTGVYGGLEHRLRYLNDPRFTSGTVWQGFRGNWVWESGVGAKTSTNPTYPGVSGVYVNGAFYPTSTTGNYSHYIDHTNGRVIFNNSIAVSSEVACSYSYKYINVTQTDGLSWFKQVQLNARADGNFVNQSGEYGQFPETRYQLPAIGIELSSYRKSTPYQLGGGHYINTDFYFHCVSEDMYLRDFMLDVLTYQKDKTIQMFNLNDISSANKFPLDYRGVPVSGAYRYPDLISNYPSSWLEISDISTDSVYELNGLFVGTVKCRTKVILGV